MKFRFILFIIVCALVQQCAKQTSPTGGPTDETPPKLISSNPRHEQTNVKKSKIELSFDEAIQLNNPREQIIITPSVGKKFEATFNKNKVELDLKTDLKENTTYSINFREAVQDLTEKNPANIKLAFSTGTYIDSLKITGTVKDALNEKLLGNYTVALAEASDTFNLFKHAASWITLTNKTGAFSLENLKPGNYYLYAFDDRSKNMIVDSKSEVYGFIGQIINLEKNIDSLKIRTFKLDVNKLKIITARTTFAYYNIRFSKSLIDYSIKPVDSTVTIHSSLEPDLTTIKLYNTIPNLDSLQVRVQAADSLNLKVDSLLYIKFPKKEATRDKFSITPESSDIKENNSTLTTTLKFSKPVTTFKPDSMFIQVDSLTRIPFTQQEYSWNPNLTRLSITKKTDLNILFPKDTSTTSSPKAKSSKKTSTGPSIIFKKSTFISVENDTSAQLISPLKLIKAEATAILETNVETNENFIIQILNKTGIVIDQRINQKKVTFENIPPDSYQLRLVVDLNKNGKWDAGDFSSKREPEPVVFYLNPKGVKDIPLKANWHVGPLLITY